MTDQVHHHHHDDIHLPRPVLIASGLFLLAVFVLTAAARITGVGVFESEPLPAVASMELRFADEADGGVAVYSADTDARIYRFEPTTGGFVRVALRALTSDRKRLGIGQEPPFVLSRSAEGQLFLVDPATDRMISLNAFSDGNAEDFGQLLDLEGDAV